MSEVKEEENLEQLCNSIWTNEDTNYQKTLKMLIENLPEKNNSDKNNKLEKKDTDKNNELNTEEKVECVKNFIFDSEVQNHLRQIDNSLMDVNIFEITGMGKYEIRHSNVLAWLFGHNNLDLHYELLDHFLLKAIEVMKNDSISDAVKKYIFLPKKMRKINIYRERYNMDLLIEDANNKIVIVIENKIDAQESINQLTNYKTTIEEKYGEYESIFIFFTKGANNASPGNEEWISIGYETLVEIIANVLERKNELSERTRMVLESYVDLLEREGIVQNQYISKLPEKWRKEYAQALSILNEYQPDLLLEISDYIRELVKKNNFEMNQSLSGKKVTFYEESMGEYLYYEFRSDLPGMPLKLVIGEVTEDNREHCNKLYKEIFGNGNKKSEWKWASKSIQLYDKKNTIEQFTDSVKKELEKNFNNAIEAFEKK